MREHLFIDRSSCIDFFLHSRQLVLQVCPFSSSWVVVAGVVAWVAIRDRRTPDDTDDVDDANTTDDGT